MKMSALRPCPLCDNGCVQIADIRHGAQCNSCRSIIEVDMAWAVITGGVLLLGSTVLFRYNLGELALVFVAGSVIYGIFVYQINSRWLPLKTYQKD